MEDLLDSVHYSALANSWQILFSERSETCETPSAITAITR